MLYTTRGIVFHLTKYSETSAIVKIYTEKFGLKTYIFKGVYKTNARIKPVVFGHLNLLEISADNRESKKMQYPKEVRIEHPYQTIPYDVKKSSVALFLSEILYKIIRHEQPDASLFNFIRNSLLWMDKENFVPNFHLWFCLQLTRYLGFFPENKSLINPVFNLEEGIFQSTIPEKQLFIDRKITPYFIELLQSDSKMLPSLNIPYEIRITLLEHIMSFYRFHIPGLTQVRSAKVLSEVLS